MGSYAYGGSAGGPCTDDKLTGEHRHNYPNPGTLGIEFARPTPVHVQRDAGGAAAAVAAYGASRRLAVLDAALVTDHGRPVVKPYERPEYVVRVTKKGKRKRELTGRMLPADVVPASARKLITLAEAHGFTTNIVELADRCAVEAMDAERRIAFRMHYHRGRADGGTWHETARYALVEDARPVGINKVSRTGLVGKRPLGVGTTRLRMLASPKGMPVSITEIEKRVREL